MAISMLGIMAGHCWSKCGKFGKTIILSSNPKPRNETREHGTEAQHHF
jgi:hypothetical protein